MTLLKHPFCRLGLETDTFRQGLRALELAAFRTPYFGDGLKGVGEALEKAQERCAPANAGIAASAAWFGVGRPRQPRASPRASSLPLEALFDSQDPVSLHTLVEAHIEAAEFSARLPWQGKRAAVGRRGR